jgi:hypothetical protein
MRSNIPFPSVWMGWAEGFASRRRSPRGSLLRLFVRQSWAEDKNVCFTLYSNRSHGLGDFLAPASPEPGGCGLASANE